MIAKFHQIRNTVALTTMAVIISAASFIGTLAGGSTLVNAACALQLSSPYAPYSYSKQATLQLPPAGETKSTESALSGVCNNNYYYQGKLTVNSNTTGACIYLKYTGSTNTASGCRQSVGSSNGPLVYRSDRTAPLYFCMIANAQDECFAGPYTNRGF
jgi:hypothetical protein